MSYEVSPDQLLAIAKAGTENAIAIAEILHRHGILDFDDAMLLRGQLNNIDRFGLPLDLHEWKGQQMSRVSHLLQALAPKE